LSSAPGLLSKIVVELTVGDDRMAASDDPFFLRLEGPEGREFRLALAKGKQLRRSSSDRFVLAAPGDPESNVAFPELNDPAANPIALRGITGVRLVKRSDPVPNVRGVGEMDDRLEIARCRVELIAASGERAIWAREGPLWLGLVCGMDAALAPHDAS